MSKKYKCGDVLEVNGGLYRVETTDPSKIQRIGGHPDGYYCWVWGPSHACVSKRGWHITDCWVMCGDWMDNHARKLSKLQTLLFMIRSKLNVRTA